MDWGTRDAMNLLVKASEALDLLARAKDKNRTHGESWSDILAIERAKP